MEWEITKQLIATNDVWLFGAVFFFGAGAFLWRRARRACRPRDEGHQPDPMEQFPIFRFFGPAFILFGISFMLFRLLEPLPWQQAAAMRRFLSVTADEVDMAVISPTITPVPQPQILRAPTFVRERDRLRELCDCIRRSESWPGGSPTRAWECELTLYRDGHPEKYTVQKCVRGPVLIDLGPVATFRSDDLGALIESWAKADKQARK